MQPVSALATWSQSGRLAAEPRADHRIFADVILTEVRIPRRNLLPAVMSTEIVSLLAAAAAVMVTSKNRTIGLRDLDQLADGVRRMTGGCVGATLVLQPRSGAGLHAGAAEVVGECCRAYHDLRGSYRIPHGVHARSCHPPMQARWPHTRRRPWRHCFQSSGRWRLRRRSPIQPGSSEAGRGSITAHGPGDGATGGRPAPDDIARRTSDGVELQRRTRGDRRQSVRSVGSIRQQDAQARLREIALTEHRRIGDVLCPN